jgi:hypothetical protein
MSRTIRKKPTDLVPGDVLCQPWGRDVVHTVVREGLRIKVTGKAVGSEELFAIEYRADDPARVPVARPGH